MGKLSHISVLIIPVLDLTFIAEAKKVVLLPEIGWVKFFITHPPA